MIENHIEHQADAAFCRFGAQLFEIFHCSVARIEISVIRNIIAVVALRGDDHRIKPDIVDSKISEVVQTGNDTLNIPPSVGIGILE